LPLLATMFSLIFAYTSTYKYRLVGNTLWYLVLLLNARLSFHLAESSIIMIIMQGCCVLYIFHFPLSATGFFRRDGWAKWFHTMESRNALIPWTDFFTT
jgi:hypothetical protein